MRRELVPLDARFYPHLVEKKARKILKGNGKARGILCWKDLSLKDDKRLKTEFLYNLCLLLGRVSKPALIQTLLPILTTDKKLSEDFLKFLAERLAANVDFLMVGEAFPIDPTEQIGKLGTLCPVEIIDIAEGYSFSSPPKVGIVLKLKIIDGKFCPLTFRRWVSKKFLYVLAKELGLKGRKTSYSGHPRELVGMRFVVLVKRSEKTGLITFERFFVGQFKNHNIKLYKLRKTPCPKNIRAPCHICPIGKDKCPVPERACRPITKEKFDGRASKHSNQEQRLLTI